ncbi:MAG: hypothetical protein WBI82_04225 [Sphaerochaeta sp.]
MNNENTDKQLKAWKVITKCAPHFYATSIDEINPIVVTEKALCVKGPSGELKVFEFGKDTIRETYNSFSFYQTHREGEEAYIVSQIAGISSWLASVETLINTATHLPCMVRNMDEITQGCKEYDYMKPLENDYVKPMEQFFDFFKNWDYLDRLKYLASIS